MAEIDYNALTHALSSRRFLPEVFDTAAEAKAAALRIIGSKSVGIGGSATVRDMGLAEALQANGNQVYWHWLAAKEAKQAARDKALTADVYMCSTNALTTDGRLVNIDGTGNRAAGLIYGPHEVIVILGKNKIVGGLDEAIDRIPYLAPDLVGAEKAARGKTPTDVWWHTIVPTNGREKTGYPTQKPEGILRRIIEQDQVSQTALQKRTCHV